MRSPSARIVASTATRDSGRTACRSHKRAQRRSAFASRSRAHTKSKPYRQHSSAASRPEPLPTSIARDPGAAAAARTCCSIAARSGDPEKRNRPGAPGPIPPRWRRARRRRSTGSARRASETTRLFAARRPRRTRPPVVWRARASRSRGRAAHQKGCCTLRRRGRSHMHCWLRTSRSSGSIAAHCPAVAPMLSACTRRRHRSAAVHLHLCSEAVRVWQTIAMLRLNVSLHSVMPRSHGSNLRRSARWSVDHAYGAKSREQTELGH